MRKQIKWTLEQKIQIVKEFKKVLLYLMKKHGIPSWATVTRCNHEYDEGRFVFINVEKENHIKKLRILVY